MDALWGGYFSLIGVLPPICQPHSTSGLCSPFYSIAASLWETLHILPLGLHSPALGQRPGGLAYHLPPLWCLTHRIQLLPESGTLNSAPPAQQDRWVLLEFHPLRVVGKLSPGRKLERTWAHLLCFLSLVVHSLTSLLSHAWRQATYSFAPFSTCLWRSGWSATIYSVTLKNSFLEKSLHIIVDRGF